MSSTQIFIYNLLFHSNMQAISMTLVEFKRNKVSIIMTNVTANTWHGIASNLLARKTVEADIIQFTTC